MFYLGFRFQSLGKAFPLSLLLLFLFFSACSYEKDYQVTVCEDRLVDLSMVSSMEEPSLLDAMLSPQVVEGDLVLINFFEEPTAEEVSSLTQLNSNIQLRWQEQEAPLSVLDVLCYSENIACFEFSSPNETFLSAQVESLGTEEAPQIALDIEYLNDLNEARYLQAILNLSATEATLNLVEYQCNLTCENSTNSFFAPELIGRICNVDCENGQTFVYEYQSNISIFTDRHNEDLAKLFEILDPSCELNEVSAQLLEVSAPFAPM